jgi:uncharacterized protein involved in high-affinity Fe2+ transport
MKPLPRPVARPAARPAAPLRRGIPAIVLGLVLAGPVLALETPIGKPQKQAGMEIAAVYLQPVPMEPAGMMKAVADSDIHLEADIRAQGDNANGFAEGAWVPYLGIAYEITKAGSPQKIAGELMPMVANDGPHYGDNVKLSGPGKLHAQAVGRAARRRGPRPLRASYGQGDRRGPVVQAVHRAIRVQLCRRRQERWLLK